MVMPTEMYKEIELLKASMQGDTIAFETIVKNYQSFICAITYSATGDVGKSEELAQETFLSAWKDLAQLKDLDKFRSWLSSIARNIIRNSFRSQKRDIISKAASMDQVEDAEIGDYGPTEKAITTEQQAVVRQALQQIPTKYREPLVLFYRQEQSIKEVAEQLELSEEAVKQRLSRGRNLLKEQIAAIVETTIRGTGPGTVFTAAVVAALPAIAPQVASAAIGVAVAKGSLMAKSAPFISTMGWILGPVLGLAGAIVAIRADLKNASMRERKFIVWTTLIPTVYFLVCGIIMVSLVLLMCSLGRSPLLFGVIYTILTLLPAIPYSRWAQRRQKQIQIEDGTYVKPEWRTLEMTKGQIYGAFGGSIFGSLVWLFRMTIATDDWGMFWIVLAAGILIFLIATKLCSRDPRYGFKIACGVFICVGILNLLVVNLRWDNKWEVILKNDRVTLTQINWLIIGVAAGLILIALIADWRHQKMRKSNSASNGGV
jgi:RNA polymerase sigma factor (sigma-70 family)